MGVSGRVGEIPGAVVDEDRDRAGRQPHRAAGGDQVDHAIAVEVRRQDPYSQVAGGEVQGPGCGEATAAEPDQDNDLPLGISLPGDHVGAAETGGGQVVDPVAVEVGDDELLGGAVAERGHKSRLRGAAVGAHRDDGIQVLQQDGRLVTRGHHRQARRVLEARAVHPDVIRAARNRAATDRGSNNRRAVLTPGVSISRREDFQSRRALSGHRI